MSLPLLTAVTPQYEAQLTAKLGTSRAVHVVRRCADLAELLGAVAAGVGRVAVISSDLRGLDRAAVRELMDAGVLVLGVHRPGDDAGERTLRRWSVTVVLPADADQPALELALAELIDEPSGVPHRAQGKPADPGLETGPDPARDQEADASAAGHRPAASRPAAADAGQAVPGGSAKTSQGGSRRTGHGGSSKASQGGSPKASQGGAAKASSRHTSEIEADEDESGDDRGRVVVVWGPVGSPGRTTVAVNVAAEVAEPTTPVILADLDTYGAAVAQVLAVLDEAPGVAAAARAADQGNLDRATLTRLAPEVSPGLRVLTGMPRPDRWTELREHAIQDVLARCAETVELTVVDVGFCLEADEELSFDTTAPRRNGAVLAALEAADEVVVVGSADPVALQRLVRGLDQLSTVTDAPVTVVVNRVRPGAVGKDPGRRIREALHRFAGVEQVILVAEDQAGLDAAVLAGRTLREARPSSPARTGLRELAAQLARHDLASPRTRGRSPRARGRSRQTARV